MPVEVVCAKCAKKYRVAEKFIGKKIRCKGCGEAIRVTDGGARGGIAAPATAGKPVVKKAVPPVKPKPVVKSRPAPEDLDLPDLPELPDYSELPELPAISYEEEDSVAQAAGCPSCGKPFPAQNVVCMACGYSRVKGNRIQTNVAKPVRREVDYASGPRQDAYGTRLWERYANPILNMLDTAIPKLAFALFLAVGITPVVVISALGLASGNPKAIGYTLWLATLIAVWMGLFYGVVLRITLYGVALAGRMFKFEVPEDGRSRILGTHVAAGAVAVVFVLIGVLMSQAAKQHQLPPFVAMALIACVVIAYAAVSFACFKLLFHLKVGEAVMGYLLMFVFYILGSLAVDIVPVILNLILHAVFPGVMAGH